MKNVILFSTQVVILKQQTSASATSTFFKKNHFFYLMLVVFCFVSHWKYHLVFQEDWYIFFWFTASCFFKQFWLETNLNKKISRKHVCLCSHVEISKPFYYEFLEETAKFSDNLFFAIPLIQFAACFFFFN